MRRFMPLAVIGAAALGCGLSGQEDITLCKEGYEASASGRQIAALTLYEACLESGRLSTMSRIRTYRNIGIAHRRNGSPKLSIKYCDMALALNPPDPWNDLVNRANAWDDQKMFDNALRDYALALEAMPNFGEAYYNRGICFEHQQRIEEARQEFKRAYQSGLRTSLLQERLVAHGMLGDVAGP